jgi:hypothetical protein
MAPESMAAGVIGGVSLRGAQRNPIADAPAFG